MDPPQEEIQKWQGVGDILGWLKLADPADPQSAGGSLLQLLGATPSTPVMLLGSIPQKDYDELIAEWKPGGQPPTPIQASQAALLGRASRVAIGAELTQDATKVQVEREKEREKELKEMELKLQAAVAKAAAQPPPATSKKKVKMSTVADQINDQEVDVLDDEKINQCYAAYNAIFKDIPPEGEECTIEQLSGLHELLKSGAPPYVDFALWGPHGYRMMRRLRLTGLLMGEGGHLRHVELPGPPDFAMWEKCYRVLRTGLLMLEAVSVSALDAYAAHFKRYHERYGPRVFLIQYQAEVRTRQEKMIIWKRQGAEEHRKNPTGSSYEPDKPWDWVWKRAVQDHYWWRCELEEPCLLVVAKTTSIDAMVDGDVHISEPVQKRSRAGPPPDDLHHHQTSIGRDTFNLQTTHSQAPKLHNVQNGNYTTNRRGVPLCEDYNAGTCTETRGQQRRCKRDGNVVHQCNKCLGEHPGSSCQKTPSNAPPAQPLWVTQRKGSPSKGKGKGKGKGKKGSWKYYG